LLLPVSSQAHHGLVWGLIRMLGTDIDGPEQHFLTFRINDDLSRGGFVMRAIVALLIATVGGCGNDFCGVEVGIDGFANGNGIA